MEPASFPEANQVFDKPDGWSRDECGAIDTFLGKDQFNRPIIVTCWKLTKDEVEELLETGRVWVYHWGTGLQPHSLTAHSPFPQENP